eukprot:2848583-Alexandrium_andersonii.AAC.1
METLRSSPRAASRRPAFCWRERSERQLRGPLRDAPSCSVIAYSPIGRRRARIRAAKRGTGTVALG